GGAGPGPTAWQSCALMTTGRVFQTEKARMGSDRSTGSRAPGTVEGRDWGWRWSARSRAATAVMRATWVVKHQEAASSSTSTHLPVLHDERDVLRPARRCAGRAGGRSGT